MKITSSYIQAANAIRGKSSRKRIVAYVESYDDILFWRNVLGEFEDETRYFEIMLPTRTTLTKGKKQAITQMLAEGGGECLIACVDADYDYLMQRNSPSSCAMLDSPYVFHTYAYAIENHVCYAPSLRRICVSATLNDRVTFDFVGFLSAFSEIVHPLFVWNILLYRKNLCKHFSIVAFNHTIIMSHLSPDTIDQALEHLSHKVRTKVKDLRRTFPNLIADLPAMSEELQRLGVTPQTTYLYVQGHNLFENVVAPLVEKICYRLRGEREKEIRQKAAHLLQLNNEISAYRNAQTDPVQVLKKNSHVTSSVPYKQLRSDLEAFLTKDNNNVTL